MKRHQHSLDVLTNRCPCGMTAAQMHILASGPPRCDPDASFLAELLVDQELTKRKLLLTTDLNAL